jgi:hypothetical protein
MAQQAMAKQATAGRTGWAGASAGGLAVPEVAVRLVGALPVVRGAVRSLSTRQQVTRGRRSRFSLRCWMRPRPVNR